MDASNTKKVLTTSPSPPSLPLTSKVVLKQSGGKPRDPTPIESWIAEYKQLATFLYDFYLLEYPQYTIPVFFGTHLFLWYVVGSLTPITILALTCALYAIFFWIVDTLGIEAKWNEFKTVLLNPTIEKAKIEKILGVKAMSQSEAETALSDFYITLRKWYESGKKLRSRNIGKFTVRLVVLLLIIAYVGSLVSGFWFVYLSVFAVLVLPTVYLLRIPRHIRLFFEPYMKEATVLIGGDRAEENDDEAILESSSSESSVGDSDESSSEDAAHYIASQIMNKAPTPTKSTRGSPQKFGRDVEVKKDLISTSSSVSSDDESYDSDEDGDDDDESELHPVRVAGNMITGARIVTPVVVTSPRLKTHPSPSTTTKSGKKGSKDEEREDVRGIHGKVLTHKRRTSSDSEESS